MGGGFAFDILQHIVVVERNGSNMFGNAINRLPDLISEPRKINVDLKNCSKRSSLVETLGAVTHFVRVNVDEKLLTCKCSTDMHIDTTRILQYVV